MVDYMKKTFTRGAGVLMPISALPSPYGIGTLGDAAFAFAAISEGTLIFLYRAHPTVLEGSVAKILSYIALFRRMDDMVYGIFDITAIVYYVSIAALFLFFTVQVIEKRRWN